MGGRYDGGAVSVIYHRDTSRALLKCGREARNLSLGEGVWRWRRLMNSAAACIGALSMSACATAIRGTTTEFSVATEPSGASVTTDLETFASRQNTMRLKRSGDYDEATAEPEFYTCAPTPCSFEVSRRSEFLVTVNLDGYHPATVQVTSGFGEQGQAVSTAGAIAVASGAYLVTVATYTSFYATLYGVASALTYGLASYGAGATAGAGVVAASGAATGLLFGGLMLGVDLASGALLDLSPNPVILVLVPEEKPFPTDTDEIIDSEKRLEEVLQANGVDLDGVKKAQLASDNPVGQQSEQNDGSTTPVKQNADDYTQP